MKTKTFPQKTLEKSNYALINLDALECLKQIPDASINCVITSPPYWNQRDYTAKKQLMNKMIGQEKTPEEYVTALVRTFQEVKRVLTPDGSFWLNIGDKYQNKDLTGMPWRVALALKDDGWILRNDIIWNKMKGTQSAKDRLRSLHEYIFHFVKSHSYYYDADSIKIKPTRRASYKNGKAISATGVSGTKYRKQIMLSTNLSKHEKRNALDALQETIERLRRGDIVDFRMTLRGEQRIYHGNSTRLSGRAKELSERGYFILTMKSSGFLPTAIWNIVPEDQKRVDHHCAVFPTDLLEIPIKSTCPPEGIVLDPFVGTGSTVLSALKHSRRGIGIDISSEYLDTARRRIRSILLSC